MLLKNTSIKTYINIYSYKYLHKVSEILFGTDKVVSRLHNICTVNTVYKI